MWDLIVSVPDHCLSFYFVTLFKKVKHLAPNHRPVSVTPMTYKTFESIVHTNVINNLWNTVSKG